MEIKPSTHLLKFSKTLKWSIAALLIILALMSVYYKFDDCGKCSFEYEGRDLNVQKFMDVYSVRCFPAPSLDLNISNFNITIP